MKIIAKSIQMIAWFKNDGSIRPIKFKIVGKDGEDIIVKIDKIFSVDIEKIAGNIMYSYICQSEIRGVERKYQIKYELDTSKWMLFKI